MNIKTELMLEYEMKQYIILDIFLLSEVYKIELNVTGYIGNMDFIGSPTNKFVLNLKNNESCSRTHFSWHNMFY